MNRNRKPMSAVVMCFFMLGACSSDDAPIPDGTPSVVAEESPSPNASDDNEKSTGRNTVKVIDTDFRPLSVTVKAGTEVEWTQIGDQPHSVSAIDGSFDSSPDCGPLDSDKCLGQGDRFSFTFGEAGALRLLLPRPRLARRYWHVRNCDREMRIKQSTIEMAMLLGLQSTKRA